VERVRDSSTRPGKLTQPYKFLDAYAVHDWDIFFGRAAAADNLHDAILSKQITVVHAKSGAGKTSLLQAGLGKRLIAEGRFPLYLRTDRPNAYEDPFYAVKTALAPTGLLGPRPALFEPVTLPEFLALFTRHVNRSVQELVLVLDQAEEFFLLPAAAAQRKAFADALAECLVASDLPLRLVIAVRADFLSDLDEFKPSLGNILSNGFRVQPLAHDEVLAAIIQPVAQLERSIRFEPALQERLVQDLLRGDLELFLLQLYCDRLYRLIGDASEIRLAAYEQIVGSAEGPLGDYVLNVVSRMPYLDRNLARGVLTRLVTVNNTRRPATTSELTEHLRIAESVYRPVLDKLIDARLVRRSDTENGYVYELSHDRVAIEVGKWFTRMQPTVEQIRQIQAALLAAFNVGELEFMLRVELSEVLQTIVPCAQRNLRQIIDDLVFYYALQPDGLQMLVQAAYNGRPNNPELQAATAAIKDIRFLPLPRLEDALLAAFNFDDFRRLIFLALDVDLDKLFRLDRLSGRQLIDLVVRYFETLPAGPSKLVAAASEANPNNPELLGAMVVLERLGRIAIYAPGVELSPLRQLSLFLLARFSTYASLEEFVADYLHSELDQIAGGGRLGAVVDNLVIAYALRPDGLQQLIEVIHSVWPGSKCRKELANLLIHYEAYQTRAREQMRMSETLANLADAVEEALLTACRSKFDFEYLTKIYFARDLYEIAPVDGNRRQIAHALVVDFAARPTGLAELVAAARMEHPDDAKLTAAAALLQDLVAPL
jgi:predicted transcriptional regulator